MNAREPRPAGVATLARVIPVVTLALATLFAALPWGLPPSERFFLPLLPIVLIHFWSLSGDAELSDWTVFAAGLSLDVMTNGPLGYWSLVYLMAQAIASASAPLAGSGWLRHAAHLLAVMLAATAIAWALASAYFMQIAEWQPYLQGAALAFAASIVVVPLVAIVDPSSRARGQKRATFRG